MLSDKVLICLLILSYPAASLANPRGDGFLAFKYADFNWDNNVFNLAGREIVMDKNDEQGLAVELSIPVEHGLNLGVELQYQSWDVISDGGTHFNSTYANVYLLTLQARYKFTETGRVRPYVGMGAGYARFSLHSETTVILDGTTYQYNLAIDFMFSEGTGLALGVMRANMNVEDKYFNKINNWATIYQASVNFHF